MVTTYNDQHFCFEVQLHRQPGNKVVITASDVKDLIHVAASTDFGGQTSDMWSPEHLFLGALSSCFMSTCLSIAQAEKLPIAHFECSVIGQVKPADDHLEFTLISLFPKIYVAKQEDMMLADKVLHTAYQKSIIAHSIKPSLIQHGKVMLQ